MNSYPQTWQRRLPSSTCVSHRWHLRVGVYFQMRTAIPSSSTTVTADR
jgi:hypothetical protein